MQPQQHRQLLALSHRSKHTQNALEAASESLLSLEQQLEHFLDTYYNEVGSDFELLSELKEQLQQAKESCFTHLYPKMRTYTATSEHFHQPRGLSGTHTLHRHVKQLYREMAKDCHPDLAPSATQDAQDSLIKSLNYAYSKRDLSSLWKLKWELERRKHAGMLSHKQRLALLQQQHQHMQAALEDIRAREEQLRSSDAYQLMQHANYLEQCGQDFIAIVKAQVNEEIEATRHKLFKAHIRQQYWQRILIQRSTSAQAA